MKRWKTIRITTLFVLCTILFSNLLLNNYSIKANASVMKISRRSLTLEIGTSKTLSISGTRKRVSWSTSKRSTATVTGNGKVYAKASGTTTITAKVSGKKFTCKVTVIKPIKISSNSLTLNAGSTKTLKISGTTKKVSWYSSNKSVALVLASGKIKAIAPGSARITASVAGKKLICSVKVKAPNIASQENAESNQAKVPDSSQVPEEPASGTNSIVVGYYAAWSKYSGYTPDKLDVSKLTHINYAFANIDENLRITLGYPDIDPTNISQLNALKQLNPNLKTLISVGGWTWSGRFSDAALTEETRSAFADSCVEFILNYGFDGVDLDWEYPVSGGLSTNIKRPEDKYNFTLLLKTIREKLDAQGNIDGKHYILTIAGGAGPWYAKNTELSVLHQYIDFANIMTYDIHGSWDQYTDFNAPLYTTTKITSNYKWSVDSSVNTWLNAGFPKEKLILGVPFYGYIYKSTGITNYGLYQTYSGGASISYANIAANYLGKPEYIKYFDNETMVPWLFNGSTFISYEDEQSMALKAQYIKSKGLGGAMIWELSQDPNWVLLTALYDNLKQ